jgi:tripartite-type tricarboxylate transporter receptor subunit TctC
MSVRMLQLTLRGFALALAAALTLAALPAVHAQERYPSRPIRMIVPFTAGTGIDVLARTTGKAYSPAEVAEARASKARYASAA